MSDRISPLGGRTSTKVHDDCLKEAADRRRAFLIGQRLAALALKEDGES